MQSDVALSLISSGKLDWFTLSPAPRTKYLNLDASKLDSRRIPQTFFPSSNTSFGHFSSGVTPATLSKASDTATAAEKVRKIELRLAGNVIEGIMEEVTDDGAILVRTSSGLQKFTAGEITISKIVTPGAGEKG